jgi:hypothetical protein
MGDQETEPFRRREHAKMMFDYFKHLTTLSTGSVLLLVTLLEKVFLNPRWKLLIAFSYGGFVISILSSVIAMLMLVKLAGKSSDPVMSVLAAGATTALASFFLSILCLAIFAVKNLH